MGKLLLNTPRLCLRDVRPEDWADLAGIWRDFERSPFAQYDAPHPADDAEIQAAAARWAAVSGDAHRFCAVCLAGEMIGYVDFHRVPEGYECGYCFHSRYHGKGYARESLRALMDWLAGGRETRFFAGTALANRPSVKLLTALGFEKIGEEPVSFYRDDAGRPVTFTGGVFALRVGP